MAYEKINWENEKTPVSAENLNHMEAGIEANSQGIDENAAAIAANMTKTVARGVFVFDDIFGTISDLTTMNQYCAPEKKMYVLDKATKSIYYVSSSELQQCKTGVIDKPEPIIALADKQEMVTLVLAALPNGDEVSY